MSRGSCQTSCPEPLSRTFIGVTDSQENVYAVQKLYITLYAHSPLIALQSRLKILHGGRHT